MHWVIVLDNLSGRGGVESVVRLVSKEIIRSHDRVSVYLPGPSENTDWEKDLPEVVYYDPVLISGRYMGLQPTWRRVLGLRRQLELRQPADVVVAGHVPRTALCARLALGYGGAPVVSWLHNPPEAFHEPEHIQYADLHWAIGSHIAAKVQAIVRGARRVVQVGNPIRLDVTPVPQPGDGEPARFLYVGRLENMQKRVDVCIRALALLNSPWTLDVYGDGPALPELQALVAELGLQARCSFHGWVEDPWTEISAATALLLTSEYEGFSVAVVEALARGIPVVASDYEGVPREFVRPDETGWIFPRGDAGALAESLRHAMDQRLFLAASERARTAVLDLSAARVVERMRESLAYLGAGAGGTRS